MMNPKDFEDLKQSVLDSVRVTGNWRIIWRFDEAGHATDVDLTDYH